jgi:diguanylate cyclase (GGDEF)-like protein/PAS domain S-box-containing protein
VSGGRKKPATPARRPAGRRAAGAAAPPRPSGPDRRWHSLLASAPALLLSVDREGRVLYASRPFDGDSARPAVGSNFCEVLEAPFQEPFRSALAAAIDSATPGALEIKTTLPADPAVWYHASVARLDEGGTEAAQVLLTEITAQKSTEEALHRSERDYRNLFENASDALLIFEPETGIIQEVNRKACETYGLPRSKIIGRSVQSVTRGPDFGEAEVEKLLREGSIDNFASVHYAGDGMPIDMLVSASTVNYGGRQAILSIHRDVTDKKRVEKQIERLANQDVLTGLANRRLFADHLDLALSHARRDGSSLGILFLDLDRFKVVNDSLGHKVGDQLLQMVAVRLARLIRAGDTLARLGGDEFVLLLHRIERPEDASLVARKILEVFRRPFRLGEHDLYVTASIGVSVFPRDGTDAEMLIRRADVAMYRAKQQGRDTFQVDDGGGQDGLERLSLETGIRKGLESGEFVAYYQPIVNLPWERVVGVEALLRWRNPERGLLLPSDFVPLAEEIGVITNLGELVLKSACAQVHQWQRAGSRELRLSVNYSARQLQQPDAAAAVARILEETGLDPASLALEITESVAMQNLESTLRTLADLKKLGVGILLDDFGTGYSSLAYLRKFPIDAIKIDQSFVRGLIANPDDASIARAAIVMAHELRMSVIAEGVETMAQRDFLLQSSCDEMQGNLFSEPLPPEELETRLIV